MDLLNGKIQTLNRKYLNAAFGSALILILPLILNASAIWYAMPNTEVLALAYAETAMKKYTDSLPVEAKKMPPLQSSGGGFATQIERPHRSSD